MKPIRRAIGPTKSQRTQIVINEIRYMKGIIADEAATLMVKIQNILQRTDKIDSR